MDCVSTIEIISIVSQRATRHTLTMDIHSSQGAYELMVISEGNYILVYYRYVQYRIV